MNRTDQIRAEINRIYKRLDREARRDRCRGDIFCGWDWPTLSIVQPATYQRLKSLMAEGRGLRTAGL